MKMKIQNYSSTVLIISPSNELLFSLYDSTYPLIDFKNKLNFFGGNYSKRDISPLGILERELREEFDNSNPRNQNIPFSPIEDIIKIRDSILNNIESSQDYLIKIIKNKTEKSYNLCSTFNSLIPEEIFSLTKFYISNGKRLTCEGGGEKIVSLEQIKKREIKFAAIAGKVLEDYTGFTQEQSETLFPKAIGKPRATLRDYLKEYDFQFM